MLISEAFDSIFAVTTHFHIRWNVAGSFQKVPTIVADIGLLCNTVTECGNVTQALAFNREVFWFNASE